MECESSSMHKKSKDQIEGEGEQRPKAGAIKGQRIAQDHRRALLEKGLHFGRMREVEGHLAEMLVAPLGLEAERPQNHMLQPGWDVGVERARALRRTER